MTEIRFTKKEAKVLDLLERNPGRIVTRKLLLENVWGYREGVKTRTVDVHVNRLRAKLAGNAGYTKYTLSLAWVTYWSAVAGRPKAKSWRRYRSSSDKPRQLRIRSRLTREHLLAGQPA
jgi:hypothetical protein